MHNKIVFFALYAEFDIFENDRTHRKKKKKNIQMKLTSFLF